MAQIIKFPADNYHAAQELVIRLWEEGAVEFGPHTLEHSEDENFNELDIYHVLRLGRIYEHIQQGEGVIRYSYNGTCIEDGPMRVVVEITGFLVIVTAHRLSA